MTAIVWRDRGRENCKGHALHVKQPDGSIHVTCSGCSLDYTIPPIKAAKR